MVMISHVALPLLAVILVALGMGVAVANDVPSLDVGPVCRAEAKAAGTYAQNCEADQKRAREDLVKQWAQFSPESQRSCLQVVNSVPGLQSYVELLTCLQIRQDVSKLPKN
jgi:hypothetical protein